MSDQKAWQIVNDKAVKISQSWPTQTEKTLNDPQWSFPKIQGDIDSYDPASREILVLEDAIQVRGQKENRIRKPSVKEDHVDDSVENPPEAVRKEKSPAVFTKIAMLQKKNQEFEFIVAPIDEKGQETVSFPDRLKARVIEEDHNEEKPLPIVAITEGAKVIR